MTTIRDINKFAIIKVIGFLLVIEGMFMLLCLVPSVYYDPEFLNHLALFNPKHDFLPLLIMGAVTLIFGSSCFLFTRKLDQNSIGKREGYIIVTLSWVMIAFFGAFPYILSGVAPNYSHAFFETMSGFTTTGATVFTDIESVPKGILFWRALTHWMGGMGIIVLSLAILPVLGIGGMQLFDAEAAGVTADKLHPRITQTAKNLWAIYVTLTLLCTIFLMFGGLSLYDSLCHAFATLATGGFSTKNTSVSEFSPYLQYVLILFMFLAGINFSLIFFAIKGKFRSILKNDELKNYIYIILSATLVVGTTLYFLKGTSVEKSIRDSLFQVVSIISTTGFVSTDYLKWPGYAWVIIFLLMFIGACTGSTGGGIKVVRIILLFRNSRMELRRLIHPFALIPVRLNGKSVSQGIIFNVLAFFLLYILVFTFGSLTMTLIGLDFESSIGGVASCLGNIGPGLGATGPILNYGFVPDVGKWVLSGLMLLGRLELFTVLLLFSSTFWNK